MSRGSGPGARAERPAVPRPGRAGPGRGQHEQPHCRLQRETRAGAAGKWLRGGRQAMRLRTCRATPRSSARAMAMRPVLIPRSHAPSPPAKEGGGRGSCCRARARRPRAENRGAGGCARLVDPPRWCPGGHCRQGRQDGPERGSAGKRSCCKRVFGRGPRDRGCGHGCALSARFHHARAFRAGVSGGCFGSAFRVGVTGAFGRALREGLACPARGRAGARAGMTQKPCAAIMSMFRMLRERPGPLQGAPAGEMVCNRIGRQRKIPCAAKSRPHPSRLRRGCPGP